MFIPMHNPDSNVVYTQVQPQHLANIVPDPYGMNLTHLVLKSMPSTSELGPQSTNVSLPFSPVVNTQPQLAIASQHSLPPIYVPTSQPQLATAPSYLRSPPTKPQIYYEQPPMFYEDGGLLPEETIETSPDENTHSQFAIAPLGSLPAQQQICVPTVPSTKSQIWYD